MTRPSLLSNEMSASTLSNGLSDEQLAAFASDPRMHINTVTKRWEYEDDDGNEFEFDPVSAKWIPVVRPILKLSLFCIDLLDS